MRLQLLLRDVLVWQCGAFTQVICVFASGCCGADCAVSFRPLQSTVSARSPQNWRMPSPDSASVDRRFSPDSVPLSPPPPSSVLGKPQTPTSAAVAAAASSTSIMASSSAAAAAAAAVPTTATTKFTGGGCKGLHAPWPTPADVSNTSSVKKASDDDADAEKVVSPISFSTASAAFMLFSAITVVAVMNLMAAVDDAALHGASAMFSSRPSANACVWSAGWITAVSTGLGVVPFLFVGNLKKFWLGACNALACGMMAAASTGLLLEAVQVQEEHHMAKMGAAWMRALLGAVAGAAFIVITQRLLEGRDDLEFSGLSGASATKMLVIVVVMTLHSLAEGVGVGVAFAGEKGGSFGAFISTTLAIHNIPEGLAICLVLVPRGVGLLEASMWAVFSSLPQPIMALPAFLSVNAFLPFLPVGLGFAAGAMLYVAFRELWPEACEDIPTKTAALIACGAAIAMGACQYVLHD